MERLTAAQRAMVAENISLVRWVVHRHGLLRHAERLGLDRDDLIQLGALGLADAAVRFDPDRGIRFSNYAKWWIRQAIGRALDDQGRLIRLPHGGRTQVQSPKFREAVALARTVISLDEPVRAQDGNEEATLGDIVADPAAGEAATVDAVAAGETAAELEHALLGVPFSLREAAVLGLRFRGGLTLEEVGEALGVTRQRAQQLEAAALARLRRDLAAMRRLARLCPAA